MENIAKELHEAVKAGDRVKVEALLAGGAEVSGRDGDGATPLHHAAVLDNQEIATALIDAGADLNARDFTHASSPMLWARHDGQVDMIRLLLDRGAAVNLVDAAKLGLNAIVEGFLADVPASLDRPVGWPTPLAGAITGNQPNTVKLLLDKGADPNARTGDGRTPLQATEWTDSNVRDEIVTLLKRRGAE